MHFELKRVEAAHLCHSQYFSVNINQASNYGRLTRAIKQFILC